MGLNSSSECFHQKKLNHSCSTPSGVDAHLFATAGCTGGYSHSSPAGLRGNANNPAVSSSTIYSCNWTKRHFSVQLSTIISPTKPPILPMALFKVFLQACIAGGKAQPRSTAQVCDARPTGVSRAGNKSLIEIQKPRTKEHKQ